MGILRDRGESDQPDQDEQFRLDQHAQNLAASGQQVWNDQGNMRTEYIREIVGHEMDDATVQLVSTYLSKQFVLSNFSEAEVHEFRWLSRELLIEIEDMHPNDRCVFTGESRKAFFDTEFALTPLEDFERNKLFQLIQAAISRAARSKQGFQQEQFGKQVKVSEVRDADGSDDGGWI